MSALPMEYLGIYQVAVCQSKLWVLVLEEAPDGQALICFSSPDGKAWTRVGGPELRIPSDTATRKNSRRVGMALTEFKDQLWLIGGSPKTRAFVSSDGIKWISKALPDSLSLGIDPSVVEHDGHLWAMRGQDSLGSSISTHLWWTKDGIEWSMSPTRAPFLPRVGMRLVSTGEMLVAVGGIQKSINPDGRIEWLDKRNEIWMGGGNGWGLADAHAPIGKRINPGLGLYQGRIWCVGGSLHESLHNPSEFSSGNLVPDAPV
jgi:hypothetical protein